MIDGGNLDCDGLSETGSGRAVNDDRFMIADLQKSMVVHRTGIALGERSPLSGGTLGHLLLVAANAGETADAQVSTITVKTIADYMLNIIPWFYRLGGQQENDFLRELVSALEQCHERIQAMADATPGSPEVGAVLTMAYMTWPRLYVIHVSTCRCYLQRGAALEQITTAHTLGQHLVESGVLPAHESATSRLSSVLWNAIGGGLEDLRPEVYKARLHVGDTLLLCTDGLSTHLPDRTISPLLQTQEPVRETCRKLVEAANSAGGTDNITVIVVRPLLPAQETGPAEKAAVAIKVPVATLSPTAPESQGVLAVNAASS